MSHEKSDDQPATKQTSLWWDNADQARYPELALAGTAEIIIVGAGITGLTTALLLQAAGRDVMLIEADRVGSGTTGYATAKVTAQHGLIYDALSTQYGPEAAATYAHANNAAMEQVAQFAARYDIDCGLMRQPAVTYTRDAAAVEKIQREVDAAQAAGLPATFTTSLDLPFPIAAAIQIDNQIMFDPRAYCAGLAAAFVSNGGALYEQTRVLEVQTDDGPTVVTQRGNVRGKHVILATQIPFLLRGGYFARTHPARSYLLAVEMQPHQALPAMMYISCDEGGHTLRPTGRDHTLLIGGEGHKTGQKEETEEAYTALIDWAHTHFSVARVTHRWSAQDYVSVDRLPYVGPVVAGDERLMVATGFSKWGLSLGTAAASILTDIVGGRESAEQALFSSTRVNLWQSAGDFLRENLNVAAHFVGDKLATLGAPAVEQLAPGEGGLARAEGATVAAFRDTDGTLHCVSPVCTHLGCTVAWNGAEKTWDCPCHGSRFAVDGRVIEGPAVKDLSPVQLNAPVSA